MLSDEDRETVGLAWTSRVVPELATPVPPGFEMESTPMQRFDYAEAFGRNIGVISAREQQRLQNTRIAIAGIGGLGSIFAHTFARMGIGRFHLADGDTFQIANFNRQLGGTISTVGHNKARAVQEQMLEINPEAAIRVWEENIVPDNIGAFLMGADLVLDEIEFFEVAAHRLLFREARSRGQTVIMAIPLGFTAGVIVFTPDGMSAEDYFDWQDGQSNEERLAHFILGLAPGRLDRNQLDLRYVDLDRHLAPSTILACFLCAGFVAMEGLRILLNRPGLKPAPFSFQFDPLSQRFRRSRLPRGNRGWIQRLKIAQLIRNYGKLRAASAKCLGPTGMPVDAHLFRNKTFEHANPEERKVKT